MSRSIHQTLKSVFGGKSPGEIQRMIDVGYPDVLELRKKRLIKRNVRNAREISALLEEVSEVPSDDEADNH